MWMKLIMLFTIGIGSLYGQAPTIENAAKLKPTKIGPHQMGETLQEALAIEYYLDNLEAVCSNNHRTRNKSECARLTNIRDGRQPAFGRGISESHQYTWTFSGGPEGKLTQVEIHVPGDMASESMRPDISEEFALLIQAYGVPVVVEKVPYQNAYGAKFDCSRMAWKMPDGTMITASESVGSPDFYGYKHHLIIIFSSREWQDSHAQTQTNPYIH